MLREPLCGLLCAHWLGFGKTLPFRSETRTGNPPIDSVSEQQDSSLWSVSASTGTFQQPHTEGFGQAASSNLDSASSAEKCKLAYRVPGREVEGGCFKIVEWYGIGNWILVCQYGLDNI